MLTSLIGGNFLIHAGKPKEILNIEARDYYGISFGSYGTLTEAEKAATALRARGGGGYILKESKFKVFGALYLNKADADSVCERLKRGGADCGVQKIEIPSYKFPCGDVIPLTKTRETLELFNFTLENLYSLFIDLEGGLISEIDAQVRLSALKNEINRQKEEYDAETSASHQIIRLKAELLSLQINIGIISEASYLSENTALEIKYYMLKIVFSYRQFVKEL
jgi:hypothetical protein